MPALLVVGYGRLGAAVIDQLVPRFPEWDFHVVARTSERALQRLNLSRYVWSQWTLYPTVKFHQLNLRDVPGMTDIINDVNPGIVFNATTPFPWWRIGELPGDLSSLADEAGAGMWAAVDTVLPYLLTMALATSNASPVHVNGCYPDLTNAFLRGQKGAPVLGIGNISNVVPGLRLSYAEEWGVDPAAVEVRCVGHHATSLNAPSTDDETPAPYLLEVATPDRRIFIEGPSAEPFRILRKRAQRTRGVEGQAVTVGSASTLLAGLMANRPGLHHSPGALGLPGGYPVHLDENRQVALRLPAGVDESRAVATNEQAQVFDGTAEVGPGIARPTEKAADAQRRILGFALEEVRLADCIDQSRQVIKSLNERYALGLESL